MKKNYLPLMILGAVLLLLGTGSCKRGATPEPTVTGPAGFRIALSGTANPSTLYVPQTSPSSSTVIAVRALRNNGTPASGYTIVFEDYLGAGYFEGFKVSDSRVTDNNGRAQINYYIPPASNIRSTLVGQIKATLVDNGRLDNVPLSDVWDVIPVRVIPYMDMGYILHGNVLTPAGSGVENVAMALTGAGGNASGVTVTRPSGSYEFLVGGGWYGILTASAPGYTFTPPQYDFPAASPVRSDRDHLDFIALFSGGNVLATDIQAWQVRAEGGSVTVNVTNSTGDSSIGYTITPSTPWLHVNPGSGSTPGSFTLVADENTSGAARAGSVRVTATDTQASTVTIAVNQLGYDVPGGSVLAADITTVLDDGTGQTVTINVFNSGNVSTSINYIITPNVDWLSPSKSSGATNDSFILTVAPSVIGDRTGTVTLTPTSTGVTNVVTITCVQSGAAVIAVTPSTLNSPWTSGATFSVTVSNPNSGTVLSWSASCDATWVGISPTSGTTDNNVVLINVQSANDTPNARQALITFTASNGATATVLLTQQGH